MQFCQTLGPRLRKYQVGFKKESIKFGQAVCKKKKETALDLLKIQTMECQANITNNLRNIFSAGVRL
jgi:hypothetical protein